MSLNPLSVLSNDLALPDQCCSVGSPSVPRQRNSEGTLGDVSMPDLAPRIMSGQPPRYVLDSSINAQASLLGRQISNISSVSSTSRARQHDALQSAQSWQSSHESFSEGPEDEDMADSDNESESSSQKSAQIIIAKQQTELRKNIVLIQSDSSLSATEKAKRIQELMSRGWNQKLQKERSNDTRQINKLSDKKIDFGIVADEDRHVSYQVTAI